MFFSRKQIVEAGMSVLAAIACAAPLGAAFDGFGVLSSTFDNQYNGNQLWDGAAYVNGWNGATSSGGTTADYSLNGTNLTYNMTTNNGWLQHDNNTTPWELGNGSWTAEVRARVGSTGGNSGFVIWGALNGERDILVVRENSVTSLGGTVYDSTDNTSGFHDFRLVYDADADAYHYFRDAVQLTPLVGVPQQAAEGTTRLIVGDCCGTVAGSPFGGPGSSFEIDYIRYDMTGAFSPTSDPGITAMTINRDTGSITLTNTTGTPIQSIIGYTILSEAGSLTQAGWDQQATGSQLASDNDQWTVLTEAGITTDLAEIILETSGDGNGGDLAAVSGTWNFGNVWRKSPSEDVTAELLLDDGTVLVSGTDFQVNYIGNDDQPFAVGDLAGATVNDGPNGEIDLVDWQKFKAAYGSDVNGLTAVGAYFAGDLTGDGVSNLGDFHEFRSIYDAANGVGAFALATSGATVPEPASWMLAMFAAFGLVMKRTVKTMNSRLRLAILCAASVLVTSTPAAAQISVPIFGDDFESYAIGDPADFTTGADNWVHNGNGTAPNASRIFASGNFVPSGTTKLWIASAPNAAAGTGLNSKNGIVLDANTNYTFSAAMVTETFDPARTATGTYDLRIGSTFGTATSVIGGPQAFSARGDDAPGGEGTYADQMTTQAFNSGSLGGSDRLFISIAFNGTNASNPFVGIDEVSINAIADFGINVNTTSGAVTFFGDSTFNLDVVSYSLTSTLGQLNPGSLTSLESQGIGDPSEVPNDGIGFEVLGTPSSSEIAEGHLTTLSTINSATNWSLGNVFDASTLAEDRDLEITFTNVDGDQFTGRVNYFAGTAVDGDYNGDGTVNLADYTVWRDNLGASNESAFASDTGNGGGVDASDYTFWKSRFGNNAGSLSAGSLSAGTTSVPEPSSALVLMGVTTVMGLVFRRARKSQGGIRHLVTASLSLIVAWAVVGSAALATITNDRLYRFGDPGSADAVSGANVGDGNSMGFSFSGRTITADEVGKGGGVGGFADLDVFGPTYVSTTARTGVANTFAANFDGTDDYLFSNTSTLGGGGLGFPGNNPPQNPSEVYTNIFSRGVQTWVRPTDSGSGLRQDIVNDTYQFGIHITQNDTWGMTWGSVSNGSPVGSVFASTTPVVFNDWSHVMQHSYGAAGAVLYVDGVVAAVGGFNNAQFYHPHAVGADLDMSLGANLEGNGNFFAGGVDDLSVYVAGDNSAVAGGMNYGAFNLATDNQYIAGLGLVPGDATGEGDVDGDDVAVFIDHWRDRQVIGGVVIGDLNSRLNQADFNFDGVTNMRDGYILHVALQQAGFAGLDFSLLNGGTNVPEPSAAILAALGVLAIGLVRRSRRV